jgi:hypothetical protein
VTSFQPDDEVTITVTGRVVHAHPGGIVVEYLRENGFPDRVAFDLTAPGVEVTRAAAPTDEEIAARQDAHWRVAEATPDVDIQARAVLAAPYRDRLSAERLVTVAGAEEWLAAAEADAA